MAWEPKTLHDALLPLIWINGIFGLGVFEIAGRPQYNLTVIYDCISAILYVIFFYEIKMNDDYNWIAYQEISYAFVFWVNIIVALVSIILGFIHTESWREIIVRCEQVDNTLEILGLKKDYRKTLRYVIYMIFMWMIVNLCLSSSTLIWLLNKVGVKWGIYLSILLHVPITINILLVFSFGVFIKILQNKLYEINVTLSEMYQLSNDINMKYKKQSYTSHKIMVAMNYYNQNSFTQHFLQVTRHVHLEIVRISRRLNKIYCLQFVLELVVEFTILIGTLYNFYFELMQLHLTDVLKSDSLLSLVFWILINSTKIIYINNLCTGLCREAQITAQSLRELEISILDNNIKSEIQQFSLQLILFPIYFSAAGFVKLNNEFTRTFFNTIATDMAILIQMSSTPSAIKSLTKIVKDY
ncbi:putative gustatory receptor 28b [Xylocopa sonorina]|uniref:putative gustatory receptor 28b n=1 Tax=Xylocopa sonorina TaxID=1818115 RepID=UPI00403B272D